MPVQILQLIPIIIIVLIFVMIYGFFAYTFKRNKKKEKEKTDLTIPEGPGYDRYREEMTDNIRKLLEEPFEEVYCTSFDGLHLAGRYYENKKGGPLLIVFHGYRSPSRRDASGVFWICKEYGCNLLIVDQRGHGNSQGDVISFGAKEHLDVLSWVKFAVDYFGKDVQIVLGGLSMGASTVMMSARLDLPENVKGIEADCGYTCPKEVIGNVAKRMGFPKSPALAVIRLGAKMIGRFDPYGFSTADVLKKSELPLLLIHGEADTQVPPEMSWENYKASAASYKKILMVPDAPHGIAYYYDKVAYTKAVTEFFDHCYEN